MQDKVNFVGLACLAIALQSAGESVVPPCPDSVGPDVIVGDITGPLNYPAANGIDALSLGTTACNIGSVWVNWIDRTSDHPVIAGNLYKLTLATGSSRFQQIGMSWLKHAFYAVNDSLCCPTCTPTDGDHLGVGCSDPYTAWRNGFQVLLGPRWQVNAHTGVFAYPPANPPIPTPTARRLEVALNELQPTGPALRYFGEAHYIAADDAAAGNQNNNASYIELGTADGGAAGGDYRFYLLGSTRRSRPAIRAWAEYDPTVVQVDIQIPGDGLMIVAYDVSESHGLWRYEYAIYNMNSDRSARSFTLPIGAGVTISDIGFHDVTYRNGDGLGGVNFDGIDWAVSQSSGSLQWSTQSFATNPNANALRWGTLYNFWFDADSPPQNVTATIGLFKPGQPNSMSVPAIGPAPIQANDCPADIAPVGSGNARVDIDDLLMVMQLWGQAGGTADIAPPPAGNGRVDMDDLFLVLSAWGPCP